MIFADAPIFHPTLAEFNQGPIKYIAKIRSQAEKYGICKIVPPKSFKPPFAINADHFQFTPRTQRLNELEASIRTKLNYTEFGFTASQKQYTFTEFAQMADEFKRNYFKSNTTDIPLSEVELEYWRLVSSLQDSVSVEYGADLHCNEFGSGFPTKTNAYTINPPAVQSNKYSHQNNQNNNSNNHHHQNNNHHHHNNHNNQNQNHSNTNGLNGVNGKNSNNNIHSDNSNNYKNTKLRDNIRTLASVDINTLKEYTEHPWNLNNTPVAEGSVFKYINTNISGMIIPWMYVGMCFSTFCWHNEDHWTYSISYLHNGEPKTWYGVPGTQAENFENSMKRLAPDLFESQPDLLHQLVTICNPLSLIEDKVPIHKVNQFAGEFVVTFPRAYHTGFNQGLNFAEAVNFAPADWLSLGRNCIDNYSLYRRYPVFSHDELICKMANDPSLLDQNIAFAAYQDMLKMIENERQLRSSALDWGVTQSRRRKFEIHPDDERQCSYCRTTCFLSALSCSCDTQTPQIYQPADITNTTNNYTNMKKIVCIPHKHKLCKTCQPRDHVLLYRYTLDELPIMLRRIVKTLQRLRNDYDDSPT